MPDARYSMLDAFMLQKDAKTSFQKKFSTKVGAKSVVFMLSLKEVIKRCQMPTRLMLDVPCFMLDATMLQKDAKTRFQKKLSTKAGQKVHPKL